MNYIATEGERLDSIYFKHYGLELNQSQYDEFCQKNHKLLLKDTLNAGDIIYIPKIQTTQEEDTKGLYGISL